MNHSSTFLSTGVAGLTLLKRGEPEEEIRASFESYRRYLEEGLRAHHGDLLRFSEEEMLAKFPQSEKAVSCALSLQNELDRFNRESNRLYHPFRIRAGVNAQPLVEGPDPKAQEEMIANLATDIQEHAAPNHTLLPGHIYELLKKTKPFFRYTGFDGVLDLNLYQSGPEAHWASTMGLGVSRAYDAGYEALEKEEFEKARDFFEAALKESTASKDIQRVASCLHALAYALGRLKKNDEKISVCLREIEIHKNLQNPRAMLSTHRNLFYARLWKGRDLERLGKFTEALESHAKALESARATGREDLIHQARANISDLEAFMKMHGKNG